MEPKEINHNFYHGFTLVEILVVMAIVMVLGGLGFSSLTGLQRTVRLNEYTATLEQQISDIQRAAMLLERKSDENWLYGLGIDMTKMVGSESVGTFTAFKWCSRHKDYGSNDTKAKIPNYNLRNAEKLSSCANRNRLEGSGCLPADSANDYSLSSCASVSESRLVLLSGYGMGTEAPLSTIEIVKTNNCGTGEAPDITAARYILFESVSGRTFFYDDVGNIINYDWGSTNGALNEGCVQDLVIKIKPLDTRGESSTRCIKVTNLGGKVTSEVASDGCCTGEISEKCDHD
ncbi:type II secretion system protein [bacterium]|nr:type II secretion system protein [bacterium]